MAVVIRKAIVDNDKGGESWGFFFFKELVCCVDEILMHRAEWKLDTS